MKNKLFAILLIAAIPSFGQVIPANIFAKKQITTAQRDAWAIPSGQWPEIYNVTDSVYQRWNGTAWEDNSLQSLVLNVNELSLTGSPVSIDLSLYLDNTDDQALTLVGNDLTLEDGGIVDLSAYLDNTDDQQISISSNILTLEDGGTVNLSSYLDNSDDQALSLAGNTLTLEDGGTVSLAPYLDNTDNQQLSLSGNTLALEDGGTVNLAGFVNTDDQTATEVNIADAGGYFAGTTVEAALQELGNTITPDATTYVELTGDYTLTSDDFGKIYYNSTTNRRIITIPDGIGTTGQKIYVDQVSSGPIFVDAPLTNQDISTVAGEMAGYHVAPYGLRPFGVRSDTIVDTSAPGDPQLLSLGAISDTSIVVNWLDATDNVATTAYNVNVDGGTKTNVGDVNTHTFTGLSQDTQYTLGISALDAWGNESTVATILGTTTGGYTASPSASNTNPELFTNSAASFFPDENTATLPTPNPSFPSGIGLSSVASVVADHGYGDNAVKIVASSSTSGRLVMQLTGLNTALTYEIYLLYKMNPGSKGRLTANGSSSINIQNLSASTWTVAGPYEWTPNATTEDITVYGASAGSVGDSMEFKISMKVKQ